MPTNSETFYIYLGILLIWWDLSEIQGSSITQLNGKNSSKSNITGTWLEKNNGLNVSRIYDLCKQNLFLFQLGLHAPEEVAILCPCIRQGKEDISETRTPNPNWDQYNLWGSQDVCICQRTRMEIQKIRKRFVNLTSSAWDKNWKLNNLTAGNSGCFRKICFQIQLIVGFWVSHKKKAASLLQSIRN